MSAERSAADGTAVALFIKPDEPTIQFEATMAVGEAKLLLKALTDVAFQSDTLLDGITALRDVLYGAVEDYNEWRPR